MSKELRIRLRELRTTNKNITPDKAWVRATRETLMMQVRNTLPAEGKASFSDRFKFSVRYILPQNAIRWVTRPMMAAMSVVIVLTGGSIMSVSAAEQSLPGDMLYGLKLATEQARLAMTPAKEDKLKLKTEFTGRRVEELKKVAVSDQKTEKVAQVAEILKRDLNTMKEQLADVASESSADKAVEAAKMVDQKSNEVITALQGAKDQLSPETKEKVTEAQSAAADTGVSALQVLVENHQKDSGSVTAIDVAQALQDHAKVVTDATTAPASLNILVSASSTATTTTVLVDLMATTTASTTSESLPGLVTQVKDATTQAFVLQKALDQLEITESNVSGTEDVATTTDQTQTVSTGTAADLITGSKTTTTSSTLKQDK
ncbi:hypothetical protein HZC53_05310 [Candidatus Uhrbacteria bacterium]|nr:hypothetical protein [Candidatus Uhrbacteria bacterium]